MSQTNASQCGSTGRRLAGAKPSTQEQGSRSAPRRRGRARRSVGAVALSFVSLIAATVVLVPAEVVFADCPKTFSYTGSVQSFTVPTGVTQLTITVRGAQGGGAGFGLAGGLGGDVVASFGVSPSDEFDVYVGGQPNSYPGGWPNGGSGDWVNTGHGAGGGGSSDVRPDGASMSGAWIVGGGGGGLSELGGSRNSVAEGVGAGVGGYPAGTGGNGPEGGKYEDTPTP